MVKLQTWLLPFCLGAAVLLTGPSALAQDFGDVVTMHGQIDGNVVTGGRIVTIDAEIDGDIVTAGRSVAIDGRIADDVLAAARDVVIGGAIVGDVRAAGAEVTTDAEIGGDLMVAARTVTVPVDTTVGGNAWLAGQSVDVFGTIIGDARAAARHVRLAGAVGGNVELSGEEITITSTARIAGDLTYRSIDSITIEPGAVIEGDTIFIRTKGPRHMVGSILAGVSALVLTLLLGLFFLGALLILIFPEAVAASARRLVSRPWATLGLGCLVLVGCPVVIFLSAISIVGIPIMIMLVAGYVAALLVGFLVAAGALGRVGARMTGRGVDTSFWTRIAAFAAGLVVFAVVGFIPLLGPLTVILATAAGLGALVLQVRDARAA